MRLKPTTTLGHLRLIEIRMALSIAREAGCKVWGKDGKVLDAEGLSARHYHVMRKQRNQLTDFPP